MICQIEKTTGIRLDYESNPEDDEEVDSGDNKVQETAEKPD